MPEEGSGRATAAALAANIGVALAKFVAFLLSGSSAMLAEAGHSVADSGDQLLLFLGRRGSRNEPNRMHPFGFGRARYMSAFVVSIVLFVAGGVFGLFEGYTKITDPHPLGPWYWPVGVLVVAVVLESFSLRTAVRVSRPMRGDRSWFAFFRRVRIPELPVILLEDSAALIGLAFALAGVVASVITGDPIYDGIGSMAIGVLLVTIAVTLAVETGSMVLGEAATQEDVGKIRKALVADGAIVEVHDLRTMHLGPEDLLVVARVGVSEADVARVTDVVDGATRRVREAMPMAHSIYVQPTAAGDGSRRGDEDERPAADEPSEDSAGP